MAQLKNHKFLQSMPRTIAQPTLATHYLHEGRVLVCLVRHGQTDWNRVKRLQGREDVPLNDEGRAQAMSLSLTISEILKHGITIGTVCSSPLSRAHDTAKYIADAFKIPDVHIVDRMIERDYGVTSGLTLKERNEIFKNTKTYMKTVETVPKTAARMIEAIDDMLEISGKHTVIGVTHGGVLNALFSRLTSGEIGTGKTLTDNCTFSIIAAGIGEPIPLAYNLPAADATSYIIKIHECGAEL